MCFSSSAVPFSFTNALWFAIFDRDWIYLLYDSNPDRLRFLTGAGINVVNMFASSILESAGVENPQRASIWLAVTHIVGSLTCMVLTESLGRCSLLTLAASGMGVFSFALTVLPEGRAPVVALVMYVTSRSPQIVSRLWICQLIGICHL
jgi:hypothetical protein